MALPQMKQKLSWGRIFFPHSGQKVAFTSEDSTAGFVFNSGGGTFASSGR
jgi:hypothetical protein